MFIHDLSSKFQALIRKFENIVNEKLGESVDTEGRSKEALLLLTADEMLDDLDALSGKSVGEISDFRVRYNLALARTSSLTLNSKELS